MEIIERAYRDWYRENYWFQDIKKRVIKWKDTLTIYCMYDNYSEENKRAIEDWYEMTWITGYNILMQCELWFEYQVEVNYILKRMVEEQKEKHNWNRYAFNCFNQSNRKYENKETQQG